MNIQTDRVLVTRNTGDDNIHLAFFYGESHEVIFGTDIDAFGKVSDYLHNLAWAASDHRNGLVLRPCYPPGTGFFIRRER